MVDLGAEAHGFDPSLEGEVVTAAGVQDRARAVGQRARAAVVDGQRDGLLYAATLLAEAGNQQVHVVADDLANRPHVLRVGGAGHQGAVAVLVPSLGDVAGHDLVQGFVASAFLAAQVRDGEALQLVTAGVAGTAEEDQSPVTPSQERLVGLLTQVRIQGDGVSLQNIEGLPGVTFVGRPDVAFLGVQDHGDSGVAVVDELDDPLQDSQAVVAILGEKCPIRLEGAGEIVRVVDDLFQKVQQNVVSVAMPGLHAIRNLGPHRVEADADQPDLVLPFLYTVPEFVQGAPPSER